MASGHGIGPGRTPLILCTAAGAVVRVHDPVATRNAALVRLDLRYADTVTQAAAGADVILGLGSPDPGASLTVMPPAAACGDHG